MSQRGNGGWEDAQAPGDPAAGLVRTDSVTEPQTRLGRWLPDAPSSEWAMRIVLHRIADQDGYATFVLRWVLWLGLVIMYGFAQAPWWAWLCLLPGAVQGPFEVATKVAHDSGAPIRNPLLRWASRTTDNSSGRFLMNGTGAVGVAAVPLQVVATAWLVPPGDPTWARPVALAFALLYLTSAISSPMNDSPYYNPRNVRGWWVVGRLARRVAGPGLSLLAMAVCLPAPWPGVPLPVMALIMCVPVAITIRTRHTDVLVRAAAHAVEEECLASRRRFYDGLHGQLTGSIKSTSRLIVTHDPPVSPELRELGLVLPLMLSGTSEMINEREWIARQGRASMRESVQALSARNLVKTQYEEDAEALDATNKHVALLVLANLIPNAAAAQRARRRRPTAALPPISVRISTTRAGIVEVAVGDSAPPVSDEFWCADGTSLDLLRERLRHLDGDLVQVRDGTHKEIVATWRHAQGGMS